MTRAPMQAIKPQTYISSTTRMIGNEPVMVVDAEQLCLVGQMLPKYDDSDVAFRVLNRIRKSVNRLHIRNYCTEMFGDLQLIT